MQRQALAWKRAGVAVGFVPTMGCLHAGHLSLVAVARRRVGPRGLVGVSVYVNPTQFGPNEDFTRYPRTLRDDLRLCRRAGVDFVFVPTDAAMYRRDAEEPFSTFVVEESVAQTLEGAARPTHFRGVTTVVAKLFHLVLPDAAVFGAKDFQQAAVIRRMVRDLNFPVQIVVAPTVREPDGLALSSRNRYLNADQRRQATALWRTIQLARRRVRSASGPLPVAALTRVLRRRLEQESELRADYIAFFDPVTFVAARRVGRGTHLALAVFVGSTRLIDNARL